MNLAAAAKEEAAHRHDRSTIAQRGLRAARWLCELLQDASCQEGLPHLVGSPAPVDLLHVALVAIETLLFGCIEGVVPRIAAAGIRAPQYIVLMTPYLATLAVMIWVGARNRGHQGERRNQAPPPDHRDR